MNTHAATYTHTQAHTQSHRHRRTESHCFRKYHKIYFDSQSKSQLPFGPTVGRFCFCFCCCVCSACRPKRWHTQLSVNRLPAYPLTRFARLSTRLSGPWLVPNRPNRDQLVLECFRLYLVVDLKIQKHPRSHKSRGRQCVHLPVPYPHPIPSCPIAPCSRPFHQACVCPASDVER